MVTYTLYAFDLGVFAEIEFISEDAEFALRLYLEDGESDDINYRGRLQEIEHILNSSGMAIPHEAAIGLSERAINEHYHLLLEERFCDEFLQAYHQLFDFRWLPTNRLPDYWTIT